MMNSLDTGLSGLLNAQERMDLIGDNIANVNTVGFKAARMTFEDSFSETLRASGNGQAPVQLGTGASPAATTSLFTQGALTNTGRDYDLAIDGTGFFLVKDTGGAEHVTRAGEFHVDPATNLLVTNTGERVQGFSDTGLTKQGDIIIDATGRPTDKGNPNSAISKVNILTNGKIVIQFEDGTEFTRGQILLQNFTNPQALMRAGGNRYGGLEAAGRLPLTAPGTGSGRIKAQALELSNVELATEFTDLITTQRAFQASARIITTSDELLQEVVSLKR